jgi:hypothetical protein
MEKIVEKLADQAVERTLRVTKNQLKAVGRGAKSIGKSIKNTVNRSYGKGSSNVQKNSVGPRNYRVGARRNPGTDMVPSDTGSYVQSIPVAIEGNTTNSFAISGHPKSGWASKLLSRYSNRSGVSIEGNEVLSIITMPQNIQPYGSNLFELPLNPAAWLDTRAQRFSLLFGRYIFSSAELQIIPSLPAALVSGKYLLAYTTDASNNMPEETKQGYIRMAEYQEAREVGLGLPATMTVPLVRSDQLYYTEEAVQSLGVDQMITNQGKLWIKLGGVPAIGGGTIAPGTELFSVRIKYTLHFVEAEIVPDDSADDVSGTCTLSFNSPPVGPPDPIDQPLVVYSHGGFTGTDVYAIFYNSSLPSGYPQAIVAAQSYYCKPNSVGQTNALFPTLLDYVADTNVVLSTLPTGASTGYTGIEFRAVKISEDTLFELKMTQLQIAETSSSRKSLEIVRHTVDCSKKKKKAV